MHRVEALVAGIRGAESGTVSAVNRGTATPATYYTDFEGTSSGTATALALDANGGRIVFFDRPVTITAYSSSGSVVRTWTAGDDAGAVELKSQSFNGTAYSGGAVAPGNPTTVEAALDKWYTSAGAVDFKVALDGVATDMDAAFAAVSGPRYFNVKSEAYGAVGDGVTNDRASIQAAMDAANAAGGIVFFPPGTYLVNGTLTSYVNVSMQGQSKLLCTIKVQSSSSSLINTTLPIGISDLSVSFTASNYTGVLFDSTVGGTLAVSNLDLQDSVVSGTVFRSTTVALTLSIKESRMLLKSAGVLFNGVAGIGTGDASISDSVIGTSEAAVMSGTLVSAPNIAISNVQAHAVDSGSGGTKTLFSSTSVTRSNNLFVTGPTSGTATVFSWGAGQLYENNTFGRLTNSLITYYGAGGSTTAFLGSRSVGRSLDSNSADPLTVSSLQYENVLIRTVDASGWAGNGNLNFNQAPIGSALTLTVWNDTAAPLTYEWGTNVSIAGGTTFAVAANSARSFSLIAHTTNGSLEWFLVGATGGAEVVE